MLFSVRQRPTPDNARQRPTTPADNARHPTFFKKIVPKAHRPTGVSTFTMMVDFNIPWSFENLKISLELYPWYRIFIVSTAPKFERQKFKCFEYI
jgi:hypothetical protein